MLKASVGKCFCGQESLWVRASVGDIEHVCVEVMCVDSVCVGFVIVELVCIELQYALNRFALTLCVL